MAQRALLEASLASLPEEIICGDGESSQVRQAGGLQRCISESIAEDIACLNTTQPTVSNVVSWQNSTIASLPEEILACNSQHGTEDRHKPIKSLLTETNSALTESPNLQTTQVGSLVSTCCPGASQEIVIRSQEQRSELQQPSLRAEDKLHVSRSSVEVQLSEKDSLLQSATMKGLDSSCESSGIVCLPHPGKLDASEKDRVLEDAIMRGLEASYESYGIVCLPHPGNLDASYDTACFKDQLANAREAVENAIMLRLDASYETNDMKTQYDADLLREELHAAKEGLEEAAMDLLDKSYMIGALRSEFDAAKVELEDIAMKKLDSSYKADELKVQLDIAKDELEEAFMEKLEKSYENGHLRAQLDAAKEELEKALKSRLLASQKAKKIAMELEEAVGRKLDVSYEMGKMGQEAANAPDMKVALGDQAKGSGLNQHEPSNREGQSISPHFEHNETTSCVARQQQPTSTSLEKGAFEDHVVKKRSPSPGVGPRPNRSLSPGVSSRPHRTPSSGASSRPHRTPSPGVSSRPLGPDAIMPSIRGRMKQADTKSAKECEAKARESYLKARLRARYRSRVLPKDHAHQKQGQSNAAETHLPHAKAACRQPSPVGKRPVSAPKSEIPHSVVGVPSRPVSKEGSTRTERSIGIPIRGDLVAAIGKEPLIHDHTSRPTPPASQNDRPNSSKNAVQNLDQTRLASAGKSQLLQGAAQSLFR